MPYRIKKGQEVILVHKNGERKLVKFNRTVDFTKRELISSPLDEHHNEGILLRSEDCPWGINIEGKWDDVGDYVELFTAEVHELNLSTAKEKVNTVVVQGSGTNQYTIALNSDGDPIECSCRSYRFTRTPCKHMRQYDG